MKKFLYSPSQYFPLFALLFMCVLQCETIVVQTKQGNIRGHEGDSRRGRKFSTFLGIPYGVVKNRFEVPFGFPIYLRLLVSVTLFIRN